MFINKKARHIVKANTQSTYVNVKYEDKSKENIKESALEKKDETSVIVDEIVDETENITKNRRKSKKINNDEEKVLENE